MSISETQIQMMLEWIDKVPLSRPKKNFARDFSDGLLAAEVVKHFYPKLIDLHNYPSSSSVQQKILNWKILNNKALKKLGIRVPEQVIEGVATSVNGMAEQAMVNIVEKLSKLAIPATSIELDEEPEVVNHNQDYEHTIQMLQTKISKLEQLLILKDKKIEQIQGHK